MLSNISTLKKIIIILLLAITFTVISPISFNNSTIFIGFPFKFLSIFIDKINNSSIFLQAININLFHFALNVLSYLITIKLISSITKKIKK